jgi:hypothetical protein
VVSGVTVCSGTHSCAHQTSPYLTSSAGGSAGCTTSMKHAGPMHRFNRASTAVPRDRQPAALLVPSMPVHGCIHPWHSDTEPASSCSPPHEPHLHRYALLLLLLLLSSSCWPGCLPAWPRASGEGEGDTAECWGEMAHGQLVSRHVLLPPGVTDCAAAVRLEARPCDCLGTANQFIQRLGPWSVCVVCPSPLFCRSR